MPTIATSSITLDNPQSDGRRIVIEQFTDDAGNIYEQSYMADAATDVNAKLAADAAALLTQLEMQNG